MSRRVEVLDYNSEWPELFEQIRSLVWPGVSDLATTIEHVGSTAVPGLPAKPIIDVCVVVASRDDVVPAIQRLATIGYEHKGNLGVEDREAFARPEGLPPHHLYLSPQDSISLINHLGVRDYLRTHPKMVKEYGALKKGLAERYPDDIDSYIEGKTDFILRILREVGLTQEALEFIEQTNRMSNIARPT